jgi:hypothetical protein
MPQKPDYFRLNGAVERSPAIAAWWRSHPDELGAIARSWFAVMRSCGDEVREVLHDGCPVACLGEAPFAYVNAFRAHVNVGFFHGAVLPDPQHLLEGTGKLMRHVKLKPGAPMPEEPLHRLITAAYAHIKDLVENG